MAILALTPLLLVAGYATMVKDILPLKKNRFRPILTSILIVAAISLTGITAVSELPYLFQDPTRIFLATAPIFENIFVQRPEFKKLSNDFDQIGFSFKDSTAAFESSQNQFQAPAKPKNLVLIMLESTGNEYISLFGGKDQTWPKLQSLKNRIEIFPFYFSTFPESANADFSTMTSLMPSNFHILQRKPEFSEATLIEYLHKNNYDCSMFFSGFLGDTGLLSFYRTRKFDRIYDALSLPEILPENSWIWGVKEHVMVDRIKQLLFTRSRKKEKPFFVYYRMIFPHAPFNTIEENSQPQFSENDLMEGKWTGRFKNCLLYMDTQIFRVIESLKEAGLEKNTYVVIMSDHATMLGKDGVYGHGWNLEPELTNVPFLIIHPEEIGFKTNRTPGSHIDIMPTLLNLLQISCNDKRIVQGTDLRSPSTHDRRIFLSSFNHKALIENNLYYWYLEDLNQARVFSFAQIEGKTVFTPQTHVDKEQVMKKVRKIKRLTSLQKTLLLNFEHYNRLYREESSND
jgi:phosphoglycerol transferase MdoB-like AlkP superfamily enzyme